MAEIHANNFLSRMNENAADGPPARYTPENSDSDTINLSELWSRLRRGIPRILGLALLGLAVAAAAYFFSGPFLSVETTTRVVFSFEGYERGLYPDKSKFQADDLRAPEVILEALKGQKLETSEEFQSKIRSAITVEGLIPASIVKERDRLRAAGQTLSAYLPDEYQVTLTLPRRFPLSLRQRELLLNQIVSAYREKFERTYVDVPLAFGNAFETLEGADFFEYELVLNTEVQNILSYLSQQLETAKTFRSQTTNLSFSDLIKQTQLFTQIRLTETLGLIRQNGLSKNRSIAMVKLDYYIRVLEDQELKATEEEKVVLDLLGKSQRHGENYVLGVKSQAMQAQQNAPLLDQGLIDSLLAHDAYNFLIREALKAGLKVRDIQAEKAVLVERRKSMEVFLKSDPGDQSQITAQVKSSLSGIQGVYKALIGDIRKTHEDYEHQQFADAVRVTAEATTSNFYRGLLTAAIVGFCIGAVLGISLSLLNLTGPGKTSFTRA